MDASQQLIDTFYTAFKNKDYKTMQQCYADDATFSDAVFVGLDAAQVKAMWQMLCQGSSADFDLVFDITSAEANTVTAQWTAQYTFSATGNKVTNHINADFALHDGKIATHIDDFNFYAWAKQAFGFKGLLLGWLPFFKTKVQQTAMVRLAKFMEKNGG